MLLQVKLADFLSILFYEIKFTSDLTRKCLVEMRSDIPGSYKGLIYCRGIDQATDVKEILNIYLAEIDKNLAAKIKRGCSEFPLAFSKYGEIREFEEDMMKYPADWKDIENEFDTTHSIKAKKLTNPSLSQFCLSDVLIIHKWIDYAKGLGDPTSELFSSLPVKYQHIFEIAKARRQG